MMQSNMRIKSVLGPLITFLFVFLATVVSLSANASAAKAPKKLEEKLKQIVQSSGFKNGELGLWVGMKADEGLQTVFGHNADKSLIPASLSKIVTAAAVLQELHPTHKFKTQLLGQADVKDGVLKGPLYLRGGGDPSFVSENMWFLVNEFIRQQITVIEGDVIVDDTRFDNIRVGDDRENARVDRAYDAPLGAMSMNWNSVNVYVRPGDKAGDPLKVFLDPTTPYLKLKNETKTTSGKGTDIAVERRTEKGAQGDVVRVSGKMALGHEEVVIYKNITQPDLWSGHHLVEFLKQRGITVKGTVKPGISPATATVLATAESKALSLIVADMMKFSNNYVAEMLVKNLAAESGNAPATMPQGIALMQKFLDARGFEKGRYVFTNASGFSRDNRLSAEQIGRLLENTRNDFTSFPEFLTSLPISGIDGTLKNRMRGGPAERWVRAKTGLLTGVVGLAGYAGKSNGEIFSFAFIYNGGGREDRARATFDKLATTLVTD